MDGINAMYILTDAEDDWTVTTKENGLVNELTLVIGEIAEDETTSHQPLDAGESYKRMLDGFRAKSIAH